MPFPMTASDFQGHLPTGCPSNAIFCTAVLQLTRFQLVECRKVPLRQLSF